MNYAKEVINFTIGLYQSSSKENKAFWGLIISYIHHLTGNITKFEEYMNLSVIFLKFSRTEATI